MVSKRTIIAIFGIAMTIVAPTLSFSESFETGRLADGRAFRTGANGVQLVDHVAELEMNVEALTRRLEAAENEIRHKDALLSEQGQIASVIAECPAVPTDQLHCPPQPQFSCLNSGEDLMASSEEAPEQVAKLEGQLNDLKNKNQILESQREKDNQWFEQTLAARDQEIASLRSITSQQIARNRGKDIDETPRAALKVSPRIINEDVEATSNPAAIKKEIENVRALLQQRNDLFSQMAHSAGALKVRPSQVETTSKRTLDMIARDAQSERSPAMIGSLSREVKEIELRLTEDIETAKRIGKIS